MIGVLPASNAFSSTRNRQLPTGRFANADSVINSQYDIWCIYNVY